MAKDKKLSSSKPPFAKGGSGKMFGKQGVGTQKAGVSSQEGKGGGGKFAKGGSGKMFGKQSVGPMPSGRSSK